MSWICWRLRPALILSALVAFEALSARLTSADDCEREGLAGEEDIEHPVAGPEGKRRNHWSVDYFDAAVFAGRRMGSLEAVERDLNFYLKEKLVAVDLVCRLNEAQKRKLHLAGTIDLARRFNQFDERRRRFEQLDQPAEKVRQEIEVEARIAQSSLYSDPFDDGSLFAKVLKSALTAEQMTRCNALLTRTARVNGVRFRENPEGLDEIQEVRFPGTDFGDDEAAGLCEIRSLECLVLDSTAITDAGMAHLRGLTNLQELDLENTKIGDRGLAHLRELRSLKRLLLGSTQVTDAGLTNLRQLFSLQELDLHETAIDGSGLTILKDLQSLRTIDLAGTQIPNRNLSHLRHCVPLERLSLRDTAVSDAGIAQLKSLVNLRELNLAGTRITDAVLAELLVLSKLEVLDLRGTSITDKGVVLLRQLPTLRHLYLFDTSVSEAAVERLQRPGREVRTWR